MSKYSDMFHDASPETFARAKSLRQNMTSSELNLWELIKVRYSQYKFRRQHPMGPYIADFYCHKLKLVIELDGHHHFEDKSQISADKQRDEDIRKWGIKVLRYPNNTNPEIIFRDIDSIISTYDNSHPHPDPKGHNRTKNR